MASPLETLFLHLCCLVTGHSDFSNSTTSFPSFPLLICPSAWQAQSPRLPLSRRTPRVAFSLCLTRRDRLLNFLMGDLLKSLLTTLVVYKGWLKEIVHLFSAASTKEIKKKKKKTDFRHTNHLACKGRFGRWHLCCIGSVIISPQIIIISFSYAQPEYMRCSVPHAVKSQRNQGFFPTAYPPPPLWRNAIGCKLLN